MPCARCGRRAGAKAARDLGCERSWRCQMCARLHECMSDRQEELVELGRENARIIGLAKSWCANIRSDRGMMGVGLVEQMTGLPIGGGTFRCDHARFPAPHGMRLNSIALEFYASNCRECEHREPAGPLLEHLGSWAESHLARREQQDQESQRVRQIADEEREMRRAARNLRLGGISAQVDSILELLNQIDAESKPADAGKRLLSLAGLAPEAFTQQVAAELRDTASVLHSSSILDALMLAYRAAGVRDEETHGLACAAVAGNWAGPETLDYVVSHATPKDIDDHPALLQAAIWRATADETSAVLEHLPAEPALLHRLLEQVPDAVLQRLLRDLTNTDPWTSSRAARAAFHVISVRPVAMAAMIDPLLAVLMRPGSDRESYAGRPKPVSNAARALALGLCQDPETIDTAIRQRWSSVGGEGRLALIKVYDRAIRRFRNDAVPQEVASMAAKAAVDTLLAGADHELMRDAGSLLQHACEDFPECLSNDTLLGVVSVLGGRLDELESFLNKPRKGEELNRDMAVLSTQAGLSHAIAASAATARRDSRSFWQACYQVFTGSDSRSRTRQALLEIAGRVGCGAAEMSDALPMLYTGMFGASPGQRAQALESIGDMDWSQVTAAPEAVVQGVLAGLSDQYLAVIGAACGAASKVPMGESERLVAVKKMLWVAYALASKRDTCRIAESAIRGALDLVHGAKMTSAVMSMCLAAINLMPAFNAVDLLVRFRVLRRDKSWPSVAIRALRPDSDPEYESIGDERRTRLLADVGKLPAEVLVPHAGDIAALATRRTSWWCRAVADVLSRAGLHGMAADIARAVVESTRDTAEQEVARLGAMQVAAAFEVEERVADKDTAGAVACLESWKELEAKAEKARSEADRAQRPFFPPLI